MQYETRVYLGWIAFFLGLTVLWTVLVVWHAVSTKREHGRYNAARAHVAALSIKVEAFWRDTHQWPLSLQSLLADDGTPNWHGPYANLSDVRDLCDSGGGEIEYTLHSDAPPSLATHRCREDSFVYDMDQPKVR